MTDDAGNTRDDQFYTGLVADLYEPLAGSLARAEPIKRFVRRYGTPALELACGAGHPMLELLADGLEVHGIDSSADMLALLHEKAEAQGLKPQVACQLMQDLDMPGPYASCYLAGASFCLLADVNDARATIERVYAHLKPGGAFLLSAFRPARLRGPARPTTKETEDGGQISVAAIAQREDAQRQIIVTTLRYQRERPHHPAETIEREWVTRWYTAAELTALLDEGGFEIYRLADFEGNAVGDDATDFSVVATRP